MKLVIKPVTFDAEVRITPLRYLAFWSLDAFSLDADGIKMKIIVFPFY